MDGWWPWMEHHAWNMIYRNLMDWWLLQCEYQHRTFGKVCMDVWDKPYVTCWFGYVWLCFGEPELMVFMSSFVSRGKQCCAIGRPESACSVYRTKQMCTPPQAALRKHGKTGDGRVKPGSNHLKILKPRTSACSKPRIATETCEHCGSWILLQVAEICPKRVLISFFTYRHDQQD